MPRNTAAAPPPRVGRDYTHAERMRVIFGIIMCILLSALDQTAVLPAIPQMAASLRGVGHLSWVVSAYLLTTTATTPIYGKLSDQLGRRAVLVPGLVVFILASVLCALAGSVPMLIAGRALQGAGGGALVAVAQAAVADVVPPRERGRYQAWFASTWAFSSVTGPVVGGLLTQHLSWRWIFWCNVPLGLLALALCVRGLRGLVTSGLRGKIDYPGALLLMLSVAAILLALSAGGVDVPWLSTSESALVATAAGLFTIFVLQQRRAPAPLFPSALLGRRTFRDILIIAFLNSAAMFGAIFLFPLLMQWVFHQKAAAAGMDIVPFLFATTVGAYAAGQAARRSGRTRPSLIAGLSIAAIGFVLLAFASETGRLTAPLSLSAVFGLGLGAIMPTTLVAVQNLADRREIGASTGVLLLLRAMGGAFGATMAGAFLALAHYNLAEGFRLGFMACALLQLAALSVALRSEDTRLRSTIEITAKA